MTSCATRTTILGSWYASESAADLYLHRPGSPGLKWCCRPISSIVRCQAHSKQTLNASVSPGEGWVGAVYPKLVCREKTMNAVLKPPFTGRPQNPVWNVFGECRERMTMKRFVSRIRETISKQIGTCTENRTRGGRRVHMDWRGQLEPESFNNCNPTPKSFRGKWCAPAVNPPSPPLPGLVPCALGFSIHPVSRTKSPAAPPSQHSKSRMNGLTPIYQENSSCSNIDMGTPFLALAVFA